MIAYRFGLGVLDTNELNMGESTVCHFFEDPENIKRFLEDHKANIKAILDRGKLLTQLPAGKYF